MATKLETANLLAYGYELAITPELAEILGRYIATVYPETSELTAYAFVENLFDMIRENLGSNN